MKSNQPDAYGAADFALSGGVDGPGWSTTSVVHFRTHPVFSVRGGSKRCVIRFSYPMLQPSEQWPRFTRCWTLTPDYHQRSPEVFSITNYPLPMRWPPTCYMSHNGNINLTPAFDFSSNPQPPYSILMTEAGEDHAVLHQPLFFDILLSTTHDILATVSS